MEERCWRRLRERERERERERDLDLDLFIHIALDTTDNRKQLPAQGKEGSRYSFSLISDSFKFHSVDGAQSQSSVFRPMAGTPSSVHNLVHTIKTKSSAVMMTTWCGK